MEETTETKTSETREGGATAAAAKAVESENGLRKMSVAEFWIRFAVWIILALAVPIGYLAFAYGLFTTSKGGDTCLTGWGTLAIVFSCVMLLVIVNQTKKGLRWGSMARQCIDGVMALLPLLCAIMLLDSVKGNIESFERFLIVTLVCEAVAVPVNPLRKWAEQNNVEHVEGFLVRTIRKAIGKDDRK